MRFFTAFPVRTKDFARFAIAIAVALFGIGILVSEVVNIIVLFYPLPPRLIAVVDRYAAGGVALIVGLVVAPVVEEGIFRGLLLRGLLALGGRPWIHIVFSATLFAAIHFNIWQFVPAFTIGIVFGWLYVRTGSLLLCIVSHAWWNFQWFLPKLVTGSHIDGFASMPLATQFPSQPVWWIVLGFLLAVGGIHQIHRQIDNHGQSVAQTLEIDSDGVVSSGRA